MELANQPPSQEILPRQTSSLCSTYAAIGAVSLPAQAVVGRVALVLPGLQLLPASGRESGPEPLEEAVVFSCLFQRWLRRLANHVMRLSIGRNRPDVVPGFFVFGQRFLPFI